MRVLALLLVSVAAFAQTAVVNGFGSGGGSATPGGSSGSVQFNNAGSLGGAAVYAATASEVAGVNLVTNGNFAGGLSGWTVSGDGTGWSIVGGKLHHTPGNDNKVSGPVVVAQDAEYAFDIAVFSQSAGTAYANLGVDCNSDCSLNFSVGHNLATAIAGGDDGATVVEIQPDSDSDITIASIGLYTARPSWYQPTLGLANIAVGPYALFAGSASGGQSNVAIGDGALLSNSAGIGNVAIGASVLPANSTGYGNLGIGQTALRRNVDGLYNTGLGYFSLHNNTSGSFNVAIGYQSGQAITGSRNLMLGSNAGSTLSNGESDQLRISNADSGGVEQNIIEGDFAQKKLTLKATVCLLPRLFSAIQVTCDSTATGTMAYITDSPTSTYGASVSAGGGANKSLIVCNGANWQVH